MVDGMFPGKPAWANRDGPWLTLEAVVEQGFKSRASFQLTKSELIPERPQTVKDLFAKLRVAKTKGIGNCTFNLFAHCVHFDLGYGLKAGQQRLKNLQYRREVKEIVTEKSTQLYSNNENGNRD